MDSSNLNELLDDALDDLLIDNDAGDEEPTPAAATTTTTKVDTTSVGPSTKKGSQSDHDKAFDEEEMNRFFANMTEQLKKELPKIDPSEAQARINESVPQIFDLMQNLLSKELLYPALKDLAPKFEEWLEKNSLTLSKEDKRRYKKQIGKINEIIDVFDNESLDAQERFEKNLDLMEQMQSLGSPPEELTVPEGMSKCSII